MNLNWNAQNTLSILSASVLAAIIVAALYWARIVFIPIALAIYLAFLLSIPADLLQRLGLRRTPAVLLVGLLALALIVGLGWLVVVQINDLAAELPSYRTNLQQKVRSLRELTENGPLARLEDLTHDLFAGHAPAPQVEAPINPDALEIKKPVSVVITTPEGEAWMSRLQGVAGVILEPLAAGVLTAVLVLFMLLQREDLRNRLIRLFGPDRISATTRAINETDRRIARFLWTQFLINAAYGAVVALGLALVGLRFALLWGVICGLFRYVPYIGPWIGAFFPLALSVILFPGWLPTSLILGMFIGLEVVTGNFVEPVLFGHSIGVSEVAMLVLAGFWTFLWGPIGLLLSGPLTVCLVVAGRHVPQLWYLDVLLGAAPPLRPSTSYYQRLLAQDQDEAAGIAQAYLREHPQEEVFDGLFVPALSLARRDRDRDELPPEREAFIVQATREIIDSVVTDHAAPPRTDRPCVRLLACPARDEEDRLALEMLVQLLDPARWEVEILPIDALAVELLETVDQEKPALVCIGSMVPGGLTHARYLCKRLRARFGTLKILVGRWGAPDDHEQRREQQAQTGADELAVSLLQARHWLDSWLPALVPQEATQPSGAARR